MSETLEEEANGFRRLRWLLVENSTAAIGEFDVGRLGRIAAIVGVDDVVFVRRRKAGDVHHGASVERERRTFGSKFEQESQTYLRVRDGLAFLFASVGRSITIGVRLKTSSRTTRDCGERFTSNRSSSV